MIHHHLPTSQQKKQTYYMIEEKKLVKVFIYQEEGEWVEYFTGFLLMQLNKGKMNLKIRFSRHPHLTQIEAGIRYPLQLFTDEFGLYTVIHQQKLKTVQKPEQSLLYLKLGHQGVILSISFFSESYCEDVHQHLSFMIEDSKSVNLTWTEQNLEFLNASMKQNSAYVVSIFILQERIVEFCDFFNEIDQKTYLNIQKDSESEDQKYMVQFFQIIKHVFLRADQKIIEMFISNCHYFETALKCLSYNPFGIYHFNYLDEFNKSTVINSSIAEFQNSDFLSNYQVITRIKFLRDVAICTFIEIPTQGVFNELQNRAYIKILEVLGNPKTHMIQKLQQLSRKDQYTYICVFSEIWEIFKAVMEDAETMIIKEVFYINWVQGGMFSETLSAIGRLLKQKEVADLHPRFWQKWMESMNPMLSYEWNQSQKMVLHHQSTINSDETMDFLSSLIMILANCDSNTKVLVLDFVRVQIELSENRKHVSAKYLSYLYNQFVSKSCEYCNNEDDIEKYIEFIQKIYVAEPIRTRHFIVQNKFMTTLKVYFKNKFVFIMLLKLLRTFIDVGDNDTFRYLSTGDFYDCVREKYAQNQNLKNVTNALFMGIFKSIESMQNNEGRKYLYRAFFATQLKSQQKETNNILLEKEELPNNFKRTVPVSGFQKQIDIEK